MIIRAKRLYEKLPIKIYSFILLLNKIGIKFKGKKVIYYHNREFAKMMLDRFGAINHIGGTTHSLEEQNNWLDVLKNNKDKWSEINIPFTNKYYD